MYYVKIFGVLLCGGFLCRAQDCNPDELRKCRETAVGILERTNGGLTKKTLEVQCRMARDSLNCMLYQTSVCIDYEDQTNKSEIIVKSWRYLTSVCDSYVDWWANPCFQRDGFKRCETLLGSSRSFDSASCRAYIGFRECVNTVVKRCREEDTALLGIYLLDKGQEKAWRCPRYPDLSLIPSEPLAADSPFNNPAQQCIMSLASETGKCSESFDKVQQKALPEDSKEERERMICCGIFSTTKCLADLMKEKCEIENPKMVESLVSSVITSTTPCKEKSNYDCSGAEILSSMNIWLIMFISFAVILLKN